MPGAPRDEEMDEKQANHASEAASGEYAPPHLTSPSAYSLSLQLAYEQVWFIPVPPNPSKSTLLPGTLADVIRS
ncbi:hypothetical protein OH77DRAFT_1419667 [Trametes cingulata]|nr:hypothetical protein OH77DRAFT_1419667 [Trametes cingulata]